MPNISTQPYATRATSREKFGTGILRTPEEIAMQQEIMREENVGTSMLQVVNLAATIERPETQEERYRKMGKAPMAEETPENITPSGRR